MGRFVGTTDARTSGAPQETVQAGFMGYTRAKVFSTAGSASTFNIPPTSTRVKVYAVGAGACYNAMGFCSQGAGCYSGVASLGCCYCMNFIGHAMGAGGGYSEKTLATSAVPGGTLCVCVGASAAVGSTPTHTSVALNGSSIMTAYSATYVNAAWSCTNNSTARSNTYDMPVSHGFDIPTCGYQNCITGYWSSPGTGSGGDVNRTGGAGVIIPEFRYDSGIFSSTNVSYTAPSGSGGGTPTYCVYSKDLVNTVFGYWCYCCYWTATGSSAGGGTTVGAQCGINPKPGSMLFPGTNTQRTTLQVPGAISGPVDTGTTCRTGSSGGGSAAGVIQCTSYAYHFYYGGCGCWCFCAVPCFTAGGSGGSGLSGSNSITYSIANKKYSHTPTGIGAGAGTSESTGLTAKSEAFIVTPIYDGTTQGGGGGGSSSDICLNASCLSGSACCCWMCTRFCGNGGPYGCFYAMVTCLGSGGGGSSGQQFTPPPYYDTTYVQTETALAAVGGGVIRISHLLNDTGTNNNDIKYGQGAGNSAGLYGGGGNRLYAPGGGLVVVLY